MSFAGGGADEPQGGNVNTWIFSKIEYLETPTMKQGASLDDDRNWRNKAITFIMMCGKELGIAQSTIGIACLMLHRFYMRFSFQDTNMYEIGSTCLFLACKVGENIRKLSQIVPIVSKFASGRMAERSETNPVKTDVFTKWRNIILYHEEILLEALCFDLYFELPHNNAMENLSAIGDAAGTDIAEHKMLTWCVLNDSLHTSLCVRYAAEIIAAAAVVFSGVLLGVDPKERYKRDWSEMVKVHETVIASICQELCDLYETVLRSGRTMSILETLHDSEKHAEEMKQYKTILNVQEEAEVYEEEEGETM